MFRNFAAAILIASLTVPAVKAEEESSSLEQDLWGLFEKFGPQMDELSRKLQEEGLQDMWKQLGPQLKELQKEMQPALEDARKLMEQFRAMDDPRHYQMPEVLPNGDIIIRRHEDAPPYQPPEEPETGPQPDGSIKT